MNDMNPWENQFRSWNPRQPSRKLKAGLFGGEQPSTIPLELDSALAWLTPATCSLALALAFWMMRYDYSGGHTYMGSNLLATAPHAEIALGSPSHVPNAEPQWNNWAVAAVDWSKVAFRGSETGIFSSWHTNIHKL